MAQSETQVSQSELATQLNARADQIDKVILEVKDLLNRLIPSSVSEELLAAARRVGVELDTLDALNVDLPAPPAPPPAAVPAETTAKKK